MVRCSLFTSALGLLSLAAAAPLEIRADVNTLDAATEAATTVRIMPFGASIVEITCWRAYLWKKLRDAGITNIDFVGSHATPSGNCTLSGTVVPFDKDNEGHSGARVTDYADQNQAVPWFAAARPDIILMHVGTNDALANISSSRLYSAYDKILSQARTQNSKVTLVASKLIPIDPKLFGQAVSDKVKEYNNGLSGWVSKNNKAESKVVMVDVETGFDYATMTREGEHPNEKGDIFMADRYFPALRDQLVVKSVEKLMDGGLL